MKVRKTVWAIIGVLGAGSIATAVPIPLVNAGFETPDGTDTDMIGWNESEFGGETWRAGTFTSPDAPWAAFSVDNPEGGRVGYLNASTSIWQNSNHALTAGETYTLSAWIGNRANDIQKLTNLVIYADNGSGGLGDLLASASVGQEEIPQGTYGQLTATFDTTLPANASLVASNLNRNLHVFIAHEPTPSGGGEITIDDVQFSFVPEPASLAALGLGGFALFGRRR